jgi:CarD family transcriptional regulator
VRLAVGDTVVYGGHGAGRVVARETRVVRGKSHEVVVLALADGLSVELRLERAQGLLRPLVSEADLSRVQETLAGDYRSNTDSWPQRLKGLQAKVSSGSPLEWAEVIRDGVGRESELLASGSKSRLSPGEKEHFAKARRLLSTEIALARGLEPADADAWIDQQLERAH